MPFTIAVQSLVYTMLHPIGVVVVPRSSAVLSSMRWHMSNNTVLYFTRPVHVVSVVAVCMNSSFPFLPTPVYLFPFHLPPLLLIPFPILMDHISCSRKSTITIFRVPYAFIVFFFVILCLRQRQSAVPVRPLPPISRDSRSRYLMEGFQSSLPQIFIMWVRITEKVYWPSHMCTNICAWCSGKDIHFNVSSSYVCGFVRRLFSAWIANERAYDASSGTLLTHFYDLIHFKLNSVKFCQHSVFISWWFSCRNVL